MKPIAMDTNTAAKTAKAPDATPSQLLALVGQSESVDRLLARHPNASGELLEALSHSSDKATRKNVALNAGAPKEALVRLAPQFPADFFMNPAFDWLLLEDPDFLFKLGQGVLKNILKRPDCPLSFLRWAASHGSEQEQLAVAMNPSVPAELIAILRKKKGAVSSAAKGRSDAVREVDLEQAFRAEVGKALASLDFDVVKSAWKRGLLGPAQWPQLSASSRARLLGLDATVFVIGALPEMAQALSVLADPQFRAVVAGHQATDLDILSRLAADKIVEVRAAVARNPACPADLMSTLASDKSPEVRAALAAHRRVSPALLQALAQDSSPLVRLAVVGSKLVTQDQLGALAKDESKRVRDSAAAVLKVRLKQPAAHPGTSAEQLAQLAASKTGTVRCAVAGNPSTPDAVMRDLAGKANAAIWQEIAGNPCVADDLHALAYGQCLAAAGPVKLIDYVLDPDCPPALRLLAAARVWRHSQRLGGEVSQMDDPTLVETFRRDCVDFWLHPSDSHYGRSCGRLDVTDIVAEQVEACARSTVQAIRLIGLAHRKVAADALVKCSKSTDWVERMAIARNPSVPPNLLAMLKRDPHILVARQAQVTENAKAEEKSRQDELLTRPSEPLDLSELAQLVCEELRRSCRPWQLAGTPWWAALPVYKRLGTGSFSNALSRSPLPMDLLAVCQESLNRCAVAESPTAPSPSVAGPRDQPDIELRASDNSKWIRKAVADDQDAPAHVLEILAKDIEWLVRSSVAENPAAPQHLLQALATDSQSWVRKSVAKNPRTPQAILEALALDQDLLVRHNVCRNPSAPWTLLKQLSADKSKYVSGGCSVRRQCEQYLLHTLRYANDAATSPDLLLALSSQSYWSVRLAALNNPAMPPEAREAGLQALWSEIKAAGTPAVLAAIELAGIATALQAMDLLPEPGDKKAIAAAAKSSNMLARVGAALTPGIQPSLLRMLLDDEFKGLRQIAVHRLQEMEAT